MRGKGFLSFLAALVLSACSEEVGAFVAPPEAPNRIATPSACLGNGGADRCLGNFHFECEGPRELSRTDCRASNLECADGFGCMACVPQSRRCNGETVEYCRNDGSGYETGPTCDAAAGLRCSADGCVDLCTQAAESRSYIGCEYAATTLRNSQLNQAFRFALVIANPQLVKAKVLVQRAGETVAQAELEPQALTTIELPWIQDLAFGAAGSKRVTDGFYRVKSDVPVVVQQFNPLKFQETNCGGSGTCFSYTNDASLLLPQHALTGSYLGAARATLYQGNASGTFASPGFLAIANTEAHAVTVRLISSAYTQAGTSITGPIAGLAPGQEETYLLQPNEVLEIQSATPDSCPTQLMSETQSQSISYCNMPEAYDLTGTQIRADGKVAVFGGHDCAFVPYNRWACDHLETQLFPVESWGKTLYMARSRALRGEPMLLRVISSAANNRIRIKGSVNEDFTLGFAQWKEVMIPGDAVVEATAPVLAAQFMVGQDYYGYGSNRPGAVGDPAMSLLIPNEQFRKSYTFLLPATYTESWVSITVARDNALVLDGAAILENYDLIPSTNFAAIRARIAPGIHRIEGREPFGISLYGVAPYTSYMVPGGLDFRAIAAPL